MNSLPRKILLAVPGKPISFYKDGGKTGLFYTEALHPYQIFTHAGFEVDLVSETGMCYLDERSVSPEFLKGEDREIYNNPEQNFNIALTQKIRKASEVDAGAYGIFFAAGGHGAIFDYPGAKNLQNLGQAIWVANGVISAVCHGPVILPYITNPKTGQSVVHGRKVTGFDTKGEAEFHALNRIRSDKAPLIEEVLHSAGAIFVAPPHPFDDFTVTDGHIVTGANPASAYDTARKAVEVFGKLAKG